MMTLITNANKQGIRFTPEEIQLVLGIMKEGKSPDEQAQIDRMIQTVTSLIGKYR